MEQGSTQEMPRACQTCRTRRIKCDRGKPVCQKCIKSQRPCVEADAAKQEHFVIHIENQYAMGKKRRPRGPRSSLVPMQPKFDLEARAHAYFVQNHFQGVQDIPDLAVTWTECFHEWKAAGKSSSIVELAFSSLALSVFAQTQKCQPAATEASKSYLRLLQDMQSRIVHINGNKLDADDIDSCLLTVYFMARYESYVQQNSDMAEPIESMKVCFHFDGAGAILKSWFDDRSRYTPTAIVKQTRRLLVKSALLLERRLPCWLEDGSLFGEQGTALEFDKFAIRIYKIRRRYSNAKRTFEESQLINPEVDKLNSEARSLDAAFQAWSTQFPSKWSYRKHSLPDTRNYPQDEFYSPTIFTCARLGYTTVWNEYLAVRMLITHTRLQIHDLTGPGASLSYQSESLECTTQLKLSAGALASFIPFCLGRVRIHPSPSPTNATSATSLEVSNEPFKPYLANLIVWPMAVASSLQKLDPVQQQWFRSCLSLIGSASCECLIAYAMSEYWTVL